MLPTPTPRFPPLSRTAHALHARLLSWFLDAPAAPFGVHRMALAGKAAGKDAGMWFGPSAAAGALRTLVDAFPACGLGVSCIRRKFSPPLTRRTPPRHPQQHPCPLQTRTTTGKRRPTGTGTDAGRPRAIRMRIGKQVGVSAGVTSAGYSAGAGRREPDLL
ncbi:hypothetical protein DFH06DRAFT_69828 [Mycena polygramma]|nr:hypothetical protein DFH06DRAFT_69828 [Mycena polygramma]